MTSGRAKRPGQALPARDTYVVEFESKQKKAARRGHGLGDGGSVTSPP